MPVLPVRKRYHLVLTLPFLSAVLALAQVDRSSLSASLKNVQCVGIVTIGGSGVPAGVAANNAMPVNTLAYPDGQIIYRIEFGIVRGEVVQMQKLFRSGTSFQIEGVDFKDDRLELRLVARNRDSGKLKLMLGSGWQNRLTNSSVLDVVEQFLSLAARPSTQTDSSPTASRPAVASSEEAVYKRPTGVKPIPNRISDEQLISILAEFETEKRRAVADILAQAGPLSNALQTIQSRANAFPNFVNNPSIQAIDSEQRLLGKKLKPQRPEDILDLIELLRNADKHFYNFAPNGCCEEIFSLANSVEEEEKFQASIAAEEQLVISAESALDEVNLAKANAAYASVSESVPSSRSRSLQQYFDMTRPLREDLESLAEQSAIRGRLSTSLSSKVHYDIQIEAASAKLSSKPITAYNLQVWLTDDKLSLKTSLESLPAFHTNVAPFTGPRRLASSSLMQFSAQYDSASKALEQLRADLRAASELTQITNDQSAMQSIRSWFGQTLADSLIAKTKGLEAAKANESALSGYIALVVEARKKEELAKSERLAEIKRQHEQEEAKKHALLEERQNLSGQIWNAIIVITMLDEKFELTQVMGYTMEASRRRNDLRGLLQRDSSLLTPDVWAEVDRAYQRVLPGLTVWQSSHARSLIAEMRFSSR